MGLVSSSLTISDFQISDTGTLKPYLRNGKVSPWRQKAVPAHVVDPQGVYADLRKLYVEVK